MYFVYANLLTLVGMFEVARPLTFRTPSTGGKSDKAFEMPTFKELYKKIKPTQ